MSACYACGRRTANGSSWALIGSRLAFCSQACVEAYQRSLSLQANQAARGSEDITAELLLAAANQGWISQANAMRGADNSMLGRQTACTNQQAATARQAAAAQQNAAARDSYVTRETVPLAIHEPLRAELDAAKKRIEELDSHVVFAEAAVRVMRIDYVPGERFIAEQSRANRLSDEAGALRTELQTVKAELCDALRDNERLKRKAGAK